MTYCSAIFRLVFRVHLLRLIASLVALFGAILSPEAVHAQPEGSFISRFSEEGGAMPEGWRISHFAVESSHNRTAWNRLAITSRKESGSPLELWLRPAPREAQKDFLGAELQRKRRTHYGHYEVVMTAASGDGIISSFFTYTGPYFGDPHDEIDFEFLGRDTTKVWINRFAKGQKLPGRWLDLGFDAASGPQLYRFDWLPDRLVWSMNGREIYRIEAEDYAIPDIPSRIYLNIWTGSEALAGWAGLADPETTGVARYYCVSYRKLGEEAPTCSDTYDLAQNVHD